MKSFREFQEQVEDALTRVLADKKRSADYGKAQIRAGMRQRLHVHNELEQRQESEKRNMK
jgi:hypothetical protein